MGSPGERPRWAGEPSTISQQPAMGRGGPKGSSGGSALKQKKKEGEKSSSIARQARRPPAAQTTQRKAAALIGVGAPRVAGMGRVQHLSPQMGRLDLTIGSWSNVVRRGARCTTANVQAV